MRYAYVLGVITGLLNLIPVLGAAVSLVLAVLVAAIDSWGRVLGVAIFFAVYLQIENSWLAPRIMRSRVNLPALAIFVSLLLGSALGGIAGSDGGDSDGRSGERAGGGVSGEEKRRVKMCLQRPYLSVCDGRPFLGLRCAPQVVAPHPVRKPNALLSANGPQLKAPTAWQTSGILRLARWADGRDTSVVTTVLSAGFASA